MQGWAWLEELPPHLHESARHLAYFVSHWEKVAALDLAWDDVPDPERLQERALLQAGLIEAPFEGSSMYRRCSR